MGWFGFNRQSRNYLGWAKISYHEIGEIGEPDVETGTCIVHFYAYGEDLDRRAVELSVEAPCWRRHDWYQQVVIPWLHGNNNLWNPIQKPSQWLIDYTERKNGYKYVDGMWVKPAPKVIHATDNVIVPAQWKK